MASTLFPGRWLTESGANSSYYLHQLGDLLMHHCGGHPEQVSDGDRTNPIYVSCFISQKVSFSNSGAALAPELRA
jgi:hypothetical protein